MLKASAIWLVLTLCSLTAHADETQNSDANIVSNPITNPIIEMQTSMGLITIELLPEKAPVTVANFLDYVESGFYDNTLFHRVIEYFMIQGGGFDEFYYKKTAGPAIKNESNNGLSNLRGTIAMARLEHPDSANSQFFINVEDNEKLDPSPTKPGYTVFGKVIAGLRVADAISAVETQNTQRFRDLPKRRVTLISVKLKPQTKRQSQ